MNTPSDYVSPEFDNAMRVHEWKNYINEKVRNIWHQFTDEQKAALAENADEIASIEEWD